jgi:hypothetical protein
MRRYGLYDATRGLTTVVAAGAAGVLLWAATRVGQPTAARFWAEMGIVAAAGLVMALSQVIGGWTKGLQLRVSPGTFLLGFLPVLIVVGWILMATQPGHGWYEGTVVSWSKNAGLMGLIHDLALWHGVLAFGFGLVLGYSFDTVPVAAAEPVAGAAVARTQMGRPVRATPMDRRAADEPLSAEREAAARSQPQTVTVGPREPVGTADRPAPDRTPETMD